MDFRTENDSLGPIRIPISAYFGTTTARAQQNFQISNQKAPAIFRVALATVKQGACRANCQLGLLTDEQARAIEKACLELKTDKYADHFTLDAYQAGAGTSYNMNANEIIANRANEILGAMEKGAYTYVHPNNHVNQAQSTNDVIPTATKIAILKAWPKLEASSKELLNKLKTLADKESNTVKVGRTHLQDAVPVTLGHELNSHYYAIEHSLRHAERTLTDLHELSLGGTAVGTGLNTDPSYQKLVIKELQKITGIPHLKAIVNNTTGAIDLTPFSSVADSLARLAATLLNFSEDLKLMNTGPKAGLQEIELPAVQPGSSIMPGKINPSILECLDMVCFQVMGYSQTVALASRRSHFQLNVYCPLVMWSILESIEILSNAISMTTELCLKGLKVKHAAIQETLDSSVCTATAFAPYLGYAQTASIVKSALKHNSSVAQEIAHQGLLTPEQVKQILDPQRLTSPQPKLEFDNL